MAQKSQDESMCFAKAGLATATRDFLYSLNSLDRVDGNLEEGKRQLVEAANLPIPLGADPECTIRYMLNKIVNGTQCQQAKLGEDQSTHVFVTQERFEFGMEFLSEHVSALQDRLREAFRENADESVLLRLQNTRRCFHAVGVELLTLTGQSNRITGQLGWDIVYPSPETRDIIAKSGDFARVLSGLVTALRQLSGEFGSKGGAKGAGSKSVAGAAKITADQVQDLLDQWAEMANGGQFTMPKRSFLLKTEEALKCFSRSCQITPTQELAVFSTRTAQNLMGVLISILRSGIMQARG